MRFDLALWIANFAKPNLPAPTAQWIKLRNNCRNGRDPSLRVQFLQPADNLVRTVFPKNNKLLCADPKPLKNLCSTLVLLLSVVLCVAPVSARSLQLDSPASDGTTMAIQKLEGISRDIPCDPANQIYQDMMALRRLDPCLSCKCVPYPESFDKLECSYEKQFCPSLDSGPDVCPVSRKEPGKCCEECKGCRYLDTEYASGDRWRSSQDACRMLGCKGGVITMSRIHCVVPCANPQRMIGYCCPLCPFTNTTMLSGNDKASEILQDPCVRCECGSGWCHCYRESCPVLDCPVAEQNIIFGTCCPECKQRRTESEWTEGSCTFRGKEFAEVDSFRPDPCTKCKCLQPGNLMCQRFVCPPINCPATRLYHSPLVCCPLCRNRDPLPCKFEKSVYKHGAEWRPDVCTQCSCQNGEASCARQSCPHAHGCPRGYRARPIPGKCCPRCEERDGSCTVFGDPHYETFDGKAFNFQGTCRYVLSTTCGYPSRNDDLPNFTVIVRNEPRGTKHFAWTRRVTIRLPNNDRVSLLPKKRVRMNRHKITPPFISSYFNASLDDRYDFTIMTDKSGNLVFRFKDVKVVWDGSSFVEVNVSPRRKGQLCGLCGNYNEDPYDDLKDPSGHTATSPYEFGMSWRWGAVSSCGLAKDRRYLRNRLKNSKHEVRNWMRTLTAMTTLKAGERAPSPSILPMSPRPFGTGNVWDYDENYPYGPPFSGIDNDDGYDYGDAGDHDVDYGIYPPNYPFTDNDGPSILQIFAGKGYRYNTKAPPKTVVAPPVHPTPPIAVAGEEVVGNDNSEVSSHAVIDSKDRTSAKVADPVRSKSMRQLRPKRRCQSKAKRRNATKLCKQLKKSLMFRPCRAVVPVARYYKSCRTDACECPSPAGQCHCESLLAYVRACEKANTRARPTLVPAQWRDSTWCGVESSDDGAPEDPHHLRSSFGTGDSGANADSSQRFDHTQDPLPLASPACGSLLGARFSICAVPLECHPTCDRLPSAELADCVRELPCHPGCECPKGTLLHYQKCIRMEECPRTRQTDADADANSLGDSVTVDVAIDSAHVSIDAGRKLESENMVVDEVSSSLANDDIAIEISPMRRTLTTTSYSAASPGYGASRRNVG